MDDDKDLNTRGAEHEASGTMDKLGGKAKEGWGKLTGDRRTEVEGKMDQAKGNLKEGLGNAEQDIDASLDR